MLHKKLNKGRKKQLRSRIILGSSAFLLAGVLSLIIGSLVNKVEAPAQRATSTSQQQSAMKTEVKAEEAKLDITSPTSLTVLVNKSHPISPVDYRPADLVKPNVKTTASDPVDEQSIRKVIQPELEAMLTAASKDGLDLTMNSGFRSYQSQTFYFNNYVKQSGLEAAKKFSAEPGHSEHQTGLAFDLSYTNRKCYLDVCFGASDAGIWLAAHAHEYGFILRYPDGKESITGYQYEPWHFRFVGKDLAKDIYQKNLTYEEYLASKNLISLN